MLVNFNVATWRYIPEDTKLHTRRSDNLKSHIVNIHRPDDGGSLHLWNVHIVFHI
jgi:hypothetical protein